MDKVIESNRRTNQQEEDHNYRAMSNGSENSTEKSLPKPKKESLRSKKLMKKQASGLENASISNNDNQISQNSIQENSSSIMNKSKAKNERWQQKNREQRLPFPLDKILIKPPYISISYGNRILGNFGHSTAIFRRPIIQGSYFLEIIVREDCRHNKKGLNSSSVRVGVCNAGFNPSYPLGYGQSLCYKSVDGSIVKGGQTIQKGQSFKVG